MTQLFLVLSLSLSISFLCSILEAVLLSLSHSYVGLLQDRRPRAGALLATLRQNIDEPIAAILTLNTIAHTVGASMGGALALEVFGSEWMALFSAALTFVILVASEIIPKTLGASFWQPLAPMTAYVLHGMVFVMRPILLPLSWIQRSLTPERAGEATISRAEIEVLAEIGRREGTLDEEEWEVVSNVINLDQVAVGEVMTPRTQMVCLPIESTVADAKNIMLKEGHFRVPVFEESVDNITGVLLARDLWRAETDGILSIREVVRPILFVPETKPVEDLIREMRTERVKMVIVLDEFGGTAGLATLEDLIEEIVGEIQDEHEQEPDSFETRGDGILLIHGQVPVWQVNEKLGATLDDEAYDTLGGFVFGSLGRIPEVGDTVNMEIGQFAVVEMDGRRIASLAFYPCSYAPSDETTPSSA